MAAKRLTDGLRSTVIGAVFTDIPLRDRHFSACERRPVGGDGLDLGNAIAGHPFRADGRRCEYLSCVKDPPAVSARTHAPDPLPRSKHLRVLDWDPDDGSTNTSAESANTGFDEPDANSAAGCTGRGMSDGT